MRKTKIVCTLGPASSTEEVLRQLILSGMDVARFNFSHGDHEDHLKKYHLIRKLSKELKKPVATLLDTKGPEIRLGKFENGKIELKQGQTFTFTTDEVVGNNERATISYKGLPGDICAGNRILIDDGLIALEVERVKGQDILCRVINGGPVSDRKGVNVPGVTLSMPFISEQDYQDIVFGIEQGFDFIAASFVRTALDVQEIRQLLEAKGCKAMRIIAKIENKQGVDNIDDILLAADGIMVARGDMGVEIPFEEVPALQKLLINKAYRAGKMVITATQMLESMIKNPRPTRAEATDVANAIYDGTSAIMLSGETAAGLHPIEAVKTMSAIANRTEADIDYQKRFYRASFVRRSDVTNAISHATCTTAYDLGAAAIITVTKSGQTARMLSKYRPEIPIIGCTPLEVTYNQLALSWGVTPVMVDMVNNSDKLFEHAVNRAKAQGLVKNGDLVVITAGVPLGIAGTTNMLKVHIVGDVLVTGQGVNKLSTISNVCVAENEQEALIKFKQNDILVIPQTSNGILDLLKKSSGIITEQEGLNSHAAIVGMALEIPVIVAAKNATAILKSGTIVNLDASRGIVFNSTTHTADTPGKNE